MRTIATFLLVAAVGLWGCKDESSGSGSAGSGDGGGTAASATTGGGAKTPSGGGATQAPELRAEDLDRGTADGTVGLFILHMQRGEFQDALMMADPESAGYGQLAKAVNVLEDTKGKQGQEGPSLEALMRAFMSRGWLGAVHEPVTVQEERARFELKLVDHDPKTLDLRLVDGEWLVVTPDWVIVKGNVDDLLPSSPAGGGGPGTDQ